MYLNDGNLAGLKKLAKKVKKAVKKVTAVSLGVPVLKKTVTAVQHVVPLAKKAAVASTGLTGTRKTAAFLKKNLVGKKNADTGAPAIDSVGTRLRARHDKPHTARQVKASMPAAIAEPVPDLSNAGVQASMQAAQTAMAPPISAAQVYTPDATDSGVPPPDPEAAEPNVVDADAATTDAPADTGHGLLLVGGIGAGLLLLMLAGKRKKR